MYCFMKLTNYFALIVFAFCGIQQCLAGCKLERHPLNALYGFNDEVHMNITMDMCQQKCLLERLPDNKVCQSLDYIMSSRTCMLSADSKASQPAFYGEHLDAIYFEKKCGSDIEDEEDPPLAPGDCKENQRGSRYRGEIKHTVSGRLCQAWASQTPHGHGYKESWKFPDRSVIMAMNYCRNPRDSVSAGPWCYTTDPNVRWEFCNIPECQRNCRNPCYTNPCSKPSICLAHHPVYCNSEFCGGCKAAYYKADANNKVNCAAEKPPPPFTTTCLISSGVEYRGTLNITTGGFTCQRWDSQHPHTHSVNDRKLLDLSIKSAENYCRNLGGTSAAPWCYTTDPNKRWEYCHINRCVQPPEKACANSDMWAIGEKTDSIRCYRFMFDEQDLMTWHEARTYCRRSFPPKADSAAILTQGQLDLLRVNAEGFIRERQLAGKSVPANVTVWFAGGNLLRKDLLPQIRQLDSPSQLYALRLWPGQPELAIVQKSDLLAVICNEIN